MKLCKAWIVVLAVLIIGAGSEAKAELNNYVVGKLGFYTPTSSDLDHYDTGFNTEAAFGHYFNPNIAVEVDAGYFRTKGDVTVYNGGAHWGDEKIEVTPLTASLRLIQPLNRTTEIYGIGGVGSYFVYSSIHASNYSDYIHMTDDTVSFGAHLGGGINVNLSRNIFVGGELKYVWLTADLYGDHVNLGGFRTTGNIGFRF